MSDKPASCASRKSSPEGTHIDGKMKEQSRRATKREITSITSIMVGSARRAAPIRKGLAERSRMNVHDGEEGGEDDEQVQPRGGRLERRAREGERHGRLRCLIGRDSR